MIPENQAKLILILALNVPHDIKQSLDKKEKLKRGLE